MNIEHPFFIESKTSSLQNSIRMMRDHGNPSQQHRLMKKSNFLRRTFMQMAIDQARKGILRNEGGPFGACLVQGEKVLAVTHNTVLLKQDPTCHAEMNAIRIACQKLKSFNLSGCEIYSTTEPCPMCLAAIHWARISHVYLGVNRKVAARFGFDDLKFYRELALPLAKRTVPVASGVLREDCERLFVEWEQLGRPLY